jgi:hypothetical protein
MSKSVLTKAKTESKGLAGRSSGTCRPPVNVNIILKTKVTTFPAFLASGKAAMVIWPMVDTKDELDEKEGHGSTLLWWIVGAEHAKIPSCPYQDYEKDSVWDFQENIGEDGRHPWICFRRFLTGLEERALDHEAMLNLGK